MDKQWFTQKDMAEILQTTKQNISLHIAEIVNDYDVDVLTLPVVASDGKAYKCKHYDLEMLCNVAVKARNPEAVKEILISLGILHPVNFKLPVKEYRFKELIEKTLKGICEFTHQHKIGNYYLVDFYFPAFRLVVEYDEVAHNKYKNDALREKELMENSMVACVIRVKEGDELEGLNEILRYIMFT